MDIYNIDELGPTTGTVFQIFANNNQTIKINILFDTGAMKSVMSLGMYEKLKLNDLNTTSIPHVVGASGKSLEARGRTKCEININGRIFYQTFIICEHLKRPIILGRDFSIQNCIGISWTKSNTRQLTQNNEVIRVFHSLYNFSRNGNFVFKGFNKSKKKVTSSGARPDATNYYWFRSPVPNQMS